LDGVVALIGNGCAWMIGPLKPCDAHIAAKAAKSRAEDLLIAETRSACFTTDKYWTKSADIPSAEVSLATSGTVSYPMIDRDRNTPDDARARYA
jgi:hypothetical protein